MKHLYILSKVTSDMIKLVWRSFWRNWVFINTLRKQSKIARWDTKLASVLQNDVDYLFQRIEMICISTGLKSTG